MISPHTAIEFPPAGIYHFQRGNDKKTSRIHLRVEEDQYSVLMVNANRIFHLNPTATLITYLFLRDIKQSEAVKVISSIYNVSKSQANRDYAQVTEQLQELSNPNGLCPIHDLNLEIIAPFSKAPSAPYRMDLAITYRCNNDCSHCYNARPRTFPELTTSEWELILNHLWELGIPHVVFTGGEPTLRQDLLALIALAEKNGQITGLNTNGRLLADRTYLQKLIDAGLDHVQITLESHDPVIHNQMVNAKHAWDQTVAGLRNVLETRLFVMTNTTMLRPNSPYLEKTIEFLAELGVPTIGLNSLIYSGRGATVSSGLKEEELKPLLSMALSITTQNKQRLIWYTPTEYCRFDPVQMDLGVKGCTAARYNMCIEPNGDVIPCQSFYQSVGNLLVDPWKNIWNHEICLNLRSHTLVPDRCKTCALLTECGGGCPLQNVYLSS
jgi:radical SAM protein with 4Fe4S-binding SPASM domain